jgi:hypothetical protein
MSSVMLISWGSGKHEFEEPWLDEGVNSYWEQRKSLIIITVTVTVC